MWAEVLSVLATDGPWVLVAFLALVFVGTLVFFAIALRRSHAEGREVSVDASVFRVIKFGVKLGAPAKPPPAVPKQPPSIETGASSSPAGTRRTSRQRKRTRARRRIASEGPS
ncbi:hypothetical protein GCM10010452_03040 [Crossiella cryophila]